LNAFSAGKEGRVAAAANASGLAGRYAGALFDLAREQGVLDEVAADLRGFRDLLGESEDLVRLIRSPVLSREEQRRALGAVARKAGFQELTAKFLGLAGQKRRAFVLPDVVEAYEAMLADHKGEASASLTSAVALTDEQTEQVKKKIAAFAGKNVSVTTSVDPSLLGGLVVRIGSRMIDASLKTKLHQLELAMKGAA
jgi:F-type H+-transporting ATPase subunit delta